MKLTAAQTREYNAYMNIPCPQCKGKMQGKIYTRPGMRSGWNFSRIMWYCINELCDQYETEKTGTQLVVGLIIDKAGTRTTQAQREGYPMIQEARK